MTTFDIFNPQISVVAKGLDGKMILVYGDNSTGKTKQATRMKKPYYLGFEAGIRAISGVPFLPINKWSDFKKINKQLTDPKTLDRAKDLYQTIIFDEVFTAAKYCQDYLCKKHGVETIGDGNNGYGLWKEYENEFWSELDKLMKAGYTLLFIGHIQETKEGKIIPKGDARSMQPVRDNADVVAYLTPNGIDENGKVIKSSAWFAQTDEFFARSRFDYIDTYLEEFTAENLEKVIAKAIERQEEEEGITAVTYEEQKESFESEELVYDDLMAKIKKLGTQLTKAGKLEELQEVVEKHLGVDAKVTECTKGQVETMAVILDDLTDLLEDIED
ncbi:SPBc2 prophage-derived protein YorG [Peribacillus asahii]|uniref:SPBc2 prophage-derived protein YorG n=1 Tax=Peribacillus asahii TaxID=228899 RepID=A0A3T0KT20_9BACI|nr:ATP-binding protein [Peribacillus asahii]AZV43589.1 SPBc2 prophage-derived protein YorG [Peribacillus asahii]